MFDTIGFIGSGRVTRIMLGGWRRAGVLPQKIFAFDSSAATVAALAENFPVVRSATLQECAACDLVFGAVHPPAMPETLEALAGHLRPSAVFCSLAPKVKLAVLADRLRLGRLARLNPNSPSIVGRGYNPIAFAEALPDTEREALLRLLAPLGQTPEVPEEMLESYAVVSAMGATYFGFQLVELKRLARSFGLAEAAARQAIHAMLHGTADLFLGGELAPEEALDLIPVRPLAEHEDAIRELYRRQLAAIYAKLTG